MLLQYHTSTHLDNILSEEDLSTYAITITHWEVLKQILSYISSTLYIGIHVQKNSSLQLEDANWLRGDIKDGKSRGAYVVYWSSN